MQETNRRLLPLRRKISAPLLLERSSEFHEESDAKSRSNSARSQCSSSPQSGNNSRYRGSPSETGLIPPLTPVDATRDREGEGERRLLRRPSEHFLEVLEEEQKRRVLPKIQTQPCAVGAHRRTSFAQDSMREAKHRGTDVVLLNALNDSPFSCIKHSGTQGTDSVSAGRLGERPIVNIPSGRVLRKVNSLPLLMSRSGETSGLVRASTPPHSRLDRGYGSTWTTLNHLRTGEHNVSGIGDVDEGDDENFGMVCEWLKQCENARAS